MGILHLNVRGMNCAACVGHASRVLDGLAGVAVRSVGIGSADVEYDPAATSADRLKPALADAGYPTAAALPLAGGSGGAGCCCGNGGGVWPRHLSADRFRSTACYHAVVLENPHGGCA